jgi:hypothetical protein
LCCATHVLVENILSIIAALVLLYFDSLFLNNPYICLHGSVSDCNTYSYNSSYSDIYSIYSTTGYTVKMACIKAQLACAVVMFVTNVIYIIIFIIVVFKIRNLSNQVEMLQQGTVPLTIGALSTGYQAQVPPTYVSSVVQRHHQSYGQHMVESHNQIT